jgi:hypothetical protein
VTNLGGAVYQITFSAPVTVTSITMTEYNILMYSPSFGAGWNPITWVNLGTSATQQVLNSDADANCTLLLIAQQPSYASASLQFQTVTPIEAV